MKYVWHEQEHNLLNLYALQLQEKENKFQITSDMPYLIPVPN